ncbi:MAG: hypothetical protein ABIF18_00315 [archaeon]
MENIQLENGRTIESHYGRNIDTAPALLARQEKGQGYMMSEADIRFTGIKNYDKHPQIANNYWNTSTLSATKGKAVKVILPYKTGSMELTESARFGLSLINPNEELVNYGVNLDVDGRWEKLEGSGVYTLQRKGLILNKDLTEAQAMKHKLILTKLGHPDYVDGKFARSKDEVAEIIGRTFELGKSEYGYDIMMCQHLPDVSDKGVLKVWYVLSLDDWAWSVAGFGLDNDYGRFAFDSVGDAKTNAETKLKIFTGSQDANQGVDVDKARAQLQSLEGMLQSGQIDKIGSALDERDALRKNKLTANGIYSEIERYILRKDEREVKDILNELIDR